MKIRSILLPLLPIALDPVLRAYPPPSPSLPPVVFVDIEVVANGSRLPDATVIHVR